ncbi:MAG: hypothetical protein AB9903_31335 [Vulcanimicrobiota bacterium]
MESDKLIDHKAYTLAKNYLPSLNIKGVNAALIEKYMTPFSKTPKPVSKQDIYLRALVSAQNANMRAGVIGGAIGGVDRLSSVLEGFLPKAILKKYGNSCDAVLDEIAEKLIPRGEIRRTPRSIWPKYCKTILSTARFIEQFDSAGDFFDWVEKFDRDERTRSALPMLLSHEIEGFGFALACDFLKEIGYMNYSKPDVHLREIFTALKLCPDKTSDYHLFKAIIRVAEHSNVSAYAVDKVFWLIGSGYFYDDPHVGKDGRVRSWKKEFIEYAYSQLYIG